jgi:hypothetical protein
MKSYIFKSSSINIKYYPIFFFTLLIFSFLFTFCSSTKETGKENEKEDEIYIFDEVPPEDSYTFEKPVNNVTFLYKIQIGAFSTRERAELFAERSRRELNRGIGISYNDDVNLFVVQLEEKFSSEIEAERVRANLWQLEDYNDAWIIPIRQKKE